MSAATNRRRPAWQVPVIVGAGVILVAFGVTLAVAFLPLFSNAMPAQPRPAAPQCQSLLGDGRFATLDQEQAQNAAIIAGIATQRRLVPRAVSIALTTAFQESGIRNLDYGDLDSVGIFQQRPAAGWGTVEQIMDPYYSTNAFYDAMIMVTNWPNADIGDVAQAVQRSAYPDLYDQHVERARILATALSGETQAVWTCHVRDPQPADPEGLQAALIKTYGDTLAVAGAAEGQIAFTAITEEAAWSAAAFAQSWAAVYGVAVVHVGEYSWTGQPDVLAGWVGQPRNLEPTALVIEFLT
jgi:hypothetical protein